MVRLLALLVTFKIVLAIKEQETILVTGNYSCGVFHLSTPAHLSCGRITVSGSHDKAPRVDWFIKINTSSGNTIQDEEPTLLSDDQYWSSQNQLHMCKYGLLYSRHLGQSGHDCSKLKTLKDSSGLYSCDYTRRQLVQPMQYRCTISTYQADNKYKIVRVKDIIVKAINPASTCHLQPACSMPIPINMTAALLGNSSMKVMWGLSPKPSYSQCSRPFCNGSKRFEVRIQAFDSVDSIQLGPIYKTTWLKTAKRRETFITLSHNAINQNNYYSYRVRNRNKTPQYSHDPDNNRRRVKTTKPVYCHFNKQHPAVLEEPVRSKVLNVAYGSYVNISCIARGQPAPRVKLMYESQDRRNVTLKQGVAHISTIYYNYLHHQRVFYCHCENTIIHPLPCGALIDSVQVEKITINVI